MIKNNSMVSVLELLQRFYRHSQDLRIQTRERTFIQPILTDGKLCVISDLIFTSFSPSHCKDGLVISLYPSTHKALYVTPEYDGLDFHDDKNCRDRTF